MLKNKSKPHFPQCPDNVACDNDVPDRDNPERGMCRGDPCRVTAENYERERRRIYAEWRVNRYRYEIERTEAFRRMFA